MPAGRRRALVALAAGGRQRGDVVIDPGADPAELRRSLVALPGIGPWTAEYVAMRALRDPDAFMPTDLGIRRAARALGLPDDPARLSPLTEALAALAELRHGPPVGAARARHRHPAPHRERTCSMTHRHHARPCPWTPRSDASCWRATATCSIGLWLPNERRHGRRDADDVPPVLKEAATQLEEYFAGERTEFDVRWSSTAPPSNRRCGPS